MYCTSTEVLYDTRMQANSNSVALPLEILAKARTCLNLDRGSQISPTPAFSRFAKARLDKLSRWLKM